MNNLNEILYIVVVFVNANSADLYTLVLLAVAFLLLYNKIINLNTKEDMDLESYLPQNYAYAAVVNASTLLNTLIIFAFIKKLGEWYWSTAVFIIVIYLYITIFSYAIVVFASWSNACENKKHNMIMISFLEIIIGSILLYKIVVFLKPYIT